MLENFFLENDIKFLKNESLKKHTTFKVGGNADFIALPDTVYKCALLVKYLNQNKIDKYFLGNGSNIVFRDEGFKGVIIKTASLNGLEINGMTAKVGAGASVTALARNLGAKGLGGMEFCYGIPGNVGGGVYMNGGAYGGEMSQVVQSVDYIDENGDLHTISAEDCKFSYRHSVFMEKDWLIAAVSFNLHRVNREESLKYMDEIMAKRREKQPYDMPSAGSSFKRPAGYFAAALIDECGLKGTSIGGAQVSRKHAGFIVNTGGATCRDIIALANYVAGEVYRQKGVVIEKEMIIV